MSQQNPIVMRFLLNVATEEPSFVDVEFSDEKQVKRALNAVMGANGGLVTLTDANDMSVLLRAESIAAAFRIEYDEEEAEEEGEEEKAAGEP